jgi:glycine/D-amino acid oxidase-like deaminating enzyme
LADVVVLGEGISGLWAAYSAAGAGAQVIVLEKRNTYTCHGPGTAGRQSPAQSPGDRDPERRGHDRSHAHWAYHPHPRLIQLWLDESGRVVDRWLAMPDAEGIT